MADKIPSPSLSSSGAFIYGEDTSQRKTSGPAESMRKESHPKQGRIIGPGAKVLRKAISFRDDIRARIRRRTSSTQRSPSPTRSPKFSAGSKPRSLQRGNSFNEGRSLKKQNSPTKCASAKIKEAGEDIFSDLVYLQKVLNLESLDQMRQCSDLLLDHFMEYSTRIKSVLIEPKPSEIQEQLINCNAQISTILRISDFVGFLGSRGEDYQQIGQLCIDLKERMEKLEVQINDYLYGLSNSMEVPTRQLRKTSSDSATRRRSLNEIDLNPIPVPSALNLHNNTDIPPPLPEKLKTPKALDDHSPVKNIESAYRAEPRRLSYYDNLPSIDGNSSESGPPPLPPKKGKSQSELNSQEESHYDNMKLREKTSADLIPPLPPKHAIQAYLNAFGSYTLPQNHELARHSVHAVNYYKQNWYEHQMLVHSPNTDSFLPIKSKTISQMTCLREERKRSSDRRTFVQDSKISDESEEDGSDDVQETPAVTVQIEKEKTEDHLKKNSADLVSNLYSDDAQIILDELIFKKKESKEGCEIKGGSVDALLIYATTSGNKDFMYQEAFLTTYRTFASTEDLIDKLISRYKKFSHMDDWKKLSRNVFSFIIRVLDELSMTELDENLFIQLMNVVHTIISDGDLSLGRVFRKQLLNKAKITKEKKLALAKSLLKRNVREYNHKITQFKAVDIAEQMTLIDSDIFNKIELAEVLLWSRHNKEDQEENFVTLMKCVHTFNNISYWCRSRIVDVHDTKEREKCYYKFLKVLKHLRRLNNFNGCMAIYSALNANVISRLEWPKQTLEDMKEFHQLFDSSASFRTYRQVLLETQAPCVPQLALVIKDLTSINEVNPDYLDVSGKKVVNFSKRQMEFNTLDNLRRFQKSKYNFKEKKDLAAFFNNFEDTYSEEQLYKMSTFIKKKN